MSERNIYRLFIASVLLKAFDGILEVALGIAFIFSTELINFIQTLAQAELIEDPSDFLAHSTEKYLPLLTTHSHFISIYLLLHGVIKLFLAAGLLRAIKWVFPTAIAIFLVFITYQLYQFSVGHSLPLLALTIFDLLVVFLTWHEYRFLFLQSKKQAEE